MRSGLASVKGKDTGDGVLVTDYEGLVTFMNATAETLMGWKTKDAMGKPLRETSLTKDMGRGLGLDARAKGFVQKPYTIEPLARRIREILDSG